MTTPDAADVYRQEAGELLDSLEGTLLDLDKTPANRDLIDAAFRALHTIKGSGAMFGFDRVAAFAHDFETVFDLVRKGKVAVSRELLAIALAAKDHIRTLIEAPEGADELIGEAILGNLQGLVAPAVASGSGSGGSRNGVLAPGDLRDAIRQARLAHRHRVPARRPAQRRQSARLARRPARTWPLHGRCDHVPDP